VVNRAQNEQWNVTSERTPKTVLRVCLWAVFAAGLLVEVMAPRLEIENNAFLMPPAANVQGTEMRPDALVRRERWMQTSAGILTVGGALALGFYYRRRLLAAVKG
jgi:hypothetical protein